MANLGGVIRPFGRSAGFRQAPWVSKRFRSSPFPHLASYLLQFSPSAQYPTLRNHRSAGYREMGKELRKRETRN